MNKDTYFYEESVVYPFVNFDIKKGYYIITDTEFSDILSFVDNNGMAGI